ncbi:MAG: glycosyltransferase [Chloroflexi bacterium]|nr:glycosyltransferase [Chloroflexota bacterium]
MKLLIISNMSHHRNNGMIVGHGATARELSILATLFDEVRHIGCLHDEPAPSSELPYNAPNIQLVPLPPTGGTTLREKLNILRTTPLYVSTILREIQKADVIHVRCPANIPLIAIILLTVVHHPTKRWVKYAGTWEPRKREALSYTFQRIWLNLNLPRSKVTVNGEWPNQSQHVYSFHNPCLTDEELIEGEKLGDLKQLATPLRLLFVGNMIKPKGIDRVLQVAIFLRDAGVNFQLDLIGEGKNQLEFQRSAQELGIENWVKFHGGLPRPLLGEFYGKGHFILLLSDTEGWPKVLSEAMAYGVVPLAGNVGSIGHYLNKIQAGRFFTPTEIESFVKAIQYYLRYPAVWKEESGRAMSFASEFSYTSYLQAVRKLLEI